VYRMINLKMADGIRLMTLRRGVDPRRFALLSFGGAAGMHAVEVARELEISRIIVPVAASVLSAWGMLTTDLRYEVSRTHYGAGARITSGEVRGLFDQLEQQAAGQMGSWFGGAVSIERSAEMRYGEQIFEIDVALTDLDWNSADVVEQIEQRFHRRHEELYTYASPDQEVVFVNARVAAIGQVASRSEHVKSASAPIRCVPRGTRLRRVVQGSGLFAGLSQARSIVRRRGHNRGRNDHDRCQREGSRQGECPGLARYQTGLVRNVRVGGQTGAATSFASRQMRGILGLISVNNNFGR
jgi:N-methylhydantoinase A/oxoprolinase/acetone carboxylase beta subunit